MALSDILLRTLSHPILVAKGSALTWVEEDTNFVEIFESLEGVTDFTNSGVAAYDGGTTYTEDDIVAYNGFLYTYINPVDSSGNAPPNPTYWELTGGASLAHVQNKDQYLDFGGAYQVSAQEIREFIDLPLDISTKWDITGNTLSARGTFGSLAGSAYGWDFKVNNSVYGGVGNDGKWFWGTNAAFTDTYFSIKSSSNLGTFNALAIKDSDNTTIFEFKSTGNIKTAGGFLNASDNVICNFYASNLYKDNSGPKVVVDWANTLLKDNDAVDTANWHYKWLLSGVTVDLDWGNHRLEGSWKVIENFSIGATPSYGSGTEQFFQMESVTPSATAPTGGIRKQVVNGAEFTLLPTGENICTAGKVITDADDYTQTVGVVKMKYTGAGGHTFTMHTAVGYAGSSYVIKNSGSGNLTIDGNSTETIDGNLTEVVPAGESRVLYSDGSNLFII